jgi:filamentous hemagglutinin
VAIKVAASKTLKVLDSFTLSVAGTFDATGTGTVETAGTGKISLANAVAATNAANFVWATAKAGTLLALELATAATLGATATIDEHTTVTLASGMTFAIPDTNSPVLTVQGILDATAGTVAVGGATDKVTFDKAHITGDNTTGVILTGSAGTASFAETNELILAATGTIATLGSGTATFGATEFSGVGTWTATGNGNGTNGSDPIDGVKITSAAADAGAIIAVSSVATTGWTAAILTATGTDPVITQAADASNALVIDTGADLNLGTVGALVLNGHASTGGKLTGAGKVVLGNASITGGGVNNGAWQAVSDSTTIKLSSTAAAVVAIEGTGTTPRLAALADDGAAITLAAGNANGDAAAVTVTNATIDISTKGSIVFPYVATAPVTLVLKGGTTTLGALKLGTGTDDLSSQLDLTCGGQVVVVSGTDIVAKGDISSSDAAALISGGTTAGVNDATITGQTATNNVTIKAGATLES